MKIMVANVKATMLSLQRSSHALGQSATHALGESGLDQLQVCRYQDAQRLLGKQIHMLQLRNYIDNIFSADSLCQLLLKECFGNAFAPGKAQIILVGVNIAGKGCCNFVSQGTFPCAAFAENTDDHMFTHLDVDTMREQHFSSHYTTEALVRLDFS